MGRIILVGLLVMVGGLTASAQINTGNELAGYCSGVTGEDPGDTNSTVFGKRMACLGFFQGVVRMQDVIRMATGRRMWCAPEAVTVGQAVKIVMKNLDENPATLHVDSTLLIINALSEAFPCDPEESFYSLPAVQDHLGSEKNNE